MKAHKPSVQAHIITTLLALLVATSAFAVPITPISYDMPSTKAAYSDSKYTGSLIGTQLIGGSGELTDGVIATGNWNVTKDPYVGWYLNPTIIFHFESIVRIGSLTLYLDDANGFGGVRLPASVTIEDGIPQVVINPPSATPLPVEFSGLDFFGDTLTLTLNRQYDYAWVFLSEVTFDGIYPAKSESLNGAAPVPEPGTLVLLGAGLFGLAVYSKRRMSRS